MPNVLSPRDLVFRPDNMDETVLSLFSHYSLIHSLKYVKVFEMAGYFCPQL